MLAEYVVIAESDLILPGSRVVELGSGTGMCGLFVATAIHDCTVEITDLPNLMELRQRNIDQNFASCTERDVATVSSSSCCQNDSNKYEVRGKDKQQQTTRKDDIGNGNGDNHKDMQGSNVTASVLDWSNVPEDFVKADVVLGADVVASLYDPVALAETIHQLCHSNTVVLVSGKNRLDKPHEIFESRLGELFGSVVKTKPTSRNRNPQVFLIKATDPIR